MGAVDQPPVATEKRKASCRPVEGLLHRDAVTVWGLQRMDDDAGLEASVVAAEGGAD